jgi:hypothetical protein
MTRRCEKFEWSAFVDRCDERLVSDALVSEISTVLRISGPTDVVILESPMGVDCVGWPGAHWVVRRPLGDGRSLTIDGWGHTLGLPPVEHQERWDLLVGEDPLTGYPSTRFEPQAENE